MGRGKEKTKAEEVFTSEREEREVKRKRERGCWKGVAMYEE